jgi:cellulose synthase operon protein C
MSIVQMLRAAAHASVWLALAAVTGGAGGCDTRARTAARVAEARASIASGDFGRASIELKSLLQSHPDDGEARLALAEASFGLGDYPSADKELDRAATLGIAPARIEPLRWKNELALGRAREVAEALGKPRTGLAEPLRLRYLALALIETGRSAEAVELLQGASEADGEAQLVLARAQAALGRTADALATLEPVLKQPQLAARAQLGRGEVLLRAGRVDEGQTALESAVSTAERDRDRNTLVLAEGALVSIALSQGKLEAARAGLKRLDSTAPNAIAVRVLTGRLALAERRFAAASDALSAVVRVLPRDAQVRMLLAIALVQQGQLGQAESQLDEFVRLQPSNVAASRMLADVQLRQGRAEAARRTLERLANDGSADAGTLLRLARAALATGDREAALRALGRAAAIDVEDPLIRIDLAGAFMEAGAPEQALSVLASHPISGDAEHRAELLRLLALSAGKRGDEAIQEARRYASARPKDAAAQYVAGSFLVAARQPGEARRYFEAALALVPGDPESLARLAQLEFSTGHVAAADSLLHRWLAAQPASVPARLALAQLATATGDTAAARRWLEEARVADPRAIEPRLRLARGYAAEGAKKPAQEVIDEALAIDPQRLGTLLTAAFVQERGGDLPKAAGYLQSAADAAPSAYHVWAELGRIRLAQNDVAGARTAFRRCLDVRPAWWPALTGLADALGRSGDKAELARLLEGLKAKPATRVQGWVLEGTLAQAAGQYQAAVAAYNHALDLERNPAVAVQRYRAQMAGHLPEAEADLRAWVASRPDDGGVRQLLADHLQGRGDLKEAIIQYEELVKRSSADPVTLNNLAWAYQLAGDKRALETARAAERLAPTVPAIADTLGWILVNSGAVPEGLGYLKRAAGASTAGPEIQYHYGAALSRAARTAEAIQMLDLAISSKDAFPSRAEAIALRERVGAAGG